MVLSQLKMLNLDCLAPGKSMAHFVGVCDKDHKGTSAPHTLCVVSVQVVLSQLKMPNLNCWGTGESIDTHIVGAGNKKDKVTSAYKCPQCP